MEQIYHDVKNPGAFGGVEKLRRATKASRKKALEFLQRDDVYTLFKPRQHRFIRRQTIAYSKFEMIQADLADMQQYSRYNKGFRYVLVAIDVLSKYSWYEPVKNKTPSEIQRAFSKIFKVATPKLLQTDQGKEFTSKIIQAYFKKKKIHWYHSHSESKATLAERAIRTLRERLARVFHYQGSYQYVHLLQDLSDVYNRTKHSRTKVAPRDVDASNENEVFERLYGMPRRSSIVPKFSVGDQVRITPIKSIFEKGHVRRWSDEIFKVNRVKLTDPVVYYVRDHDGEEMPGAFYGQELNRVSKQESDLWDIERIIKKRKNKNGKTEYYVKWKGYGNEHNSWVTDIKKK